MAVAAPVTDRTKPATPPTKHYKVAGGAGARSAQGADDASLETHAAHLLGRCSGASGNKQSMRGKIVVAATRSNDGARMTSRV